jgi:hypothetical protein
VAVAHGVGVRLSQWRRCPLGAPAAVTAVIAGQSSVLDGIRGKCGRQVPAAHIPTGVARAAGPGHEQATRHCPPGVQVRTRHIGWGASDCCRSADGRLRQRPILDA